MTTLAYYLPNTIEVGGILQEMAMRIPCFVQIYTEDKGAYKEEAEVIIECREMDAAFVEETLAKFV